MKLIQRRDVFLSSADKAGGDRGEFVVQLPYDFVFDEKMFFKLWISQLNIRNTFFWITARNSEFYFQALPVGSPAPEPPDDDDSGLWQFAYLGDGCPSTGVICQQLNQMFRDLADDVPPAFPAVDMTQIYCFHRSGRALFHVNSDKQMYDLYFYFRDPHDELGPCNRALGFPSTNTVYHIEPSFGELSPRHAQDRRWSALDGAPIRAFNVSQSPSLMDPDSLTSLYIKTSMPSDNYTLSKDGPELTGISVNIPLITGPGSSIVYEDIMGTHAIYEHAKSVVNNLRVEVLDKNFMKVIPDHDWSFIMSIEQYEDTDGETIEELQQSNQAQAEMSQLLKMLLLSTEYKR